MKNKVICLLAMSTPATSQAATTEPTRKRRRRFVHKVLTYPVSYEWLKQRSTELWGAPSTKRTIQHLQLHSGQPQRMLQSVYNKETGDILIRVPLADNTWPKEIQIPSAKDVETMRNYIGATGEP